MIIKCNVSLFPMYKSRNSMYKKQSILEKQNEMPYRIFYHFIIFFFLKSFNEANYETRLFITKLTKNEFARNNGGNLIK